LFAAPPTPRPVSPAEVRPAAYAQSTPNAAWNGHGFVAVWDDQRMQERSSFTSATAAYATRLDENGHSRDPYGVQIGPSMSFRPFVASNGHGTLAAYSTGAGGWIVPLDDNAHPAASMRNIAKGEIAGLASNGSTYCALIAGYASAHAQLLDDQGAALATLPINGWAAAIVAAQGRYIVITVDGTRVVATTISASGFQIDQRTLGDAGTQQFGVVAHSNGTRVLVAWYAQTEERRFIDEVALYAHGAPVEGVRRVFEAEGARYDQVYPPSLAWDGRSFLLIHSDGGLQAMRIDTDGDPLGEPVALNADAQQLSAVFDGTRVLLLSAERRSEADDPVSRVVTSFASLQELPQPNVISFSPAPQADPDVAVASGVALAVSREDESYGSITASLFSPAAPGNESHVVVAGPRSYTKQDGPSVAADGDLFLVVWREAADYRTRILAQRVTLSGALLGPELVIADEPKTYANFAVTDVAFDGTNFLAAWHSQDDEIRVRGITPGGAFTGPAVTVSRHDASEKRERRTPAVIWTGETYLVAWSEDLPLIGGVSETNPLRNIYRAARVTRDGTLLDTTESLSLFTVDGYSHNIALAVGGDRVLLASATGAYLGNSQWYIHAQLFDLAGNPVGDVQRIDTAVKAKRIHPAAAWNGRSFSVFWTEQVTDDATFLTGARVLADGTLGDRIDGGNLRSFAAAAASVPGGVLVVETLIAPEQANVARLYARTFVTHLPKGRAARH
jgi:hypothetical protein